jgi:hypothetical protein
MFELLFTEGDVASLFMALQNSLSSKAKSFSSKKAMRHGEDLNPK